MNIAPLLVIILLGLVVYVFATRPKLPPETDAIIDAVLNGELPELVVGQSGFAFCEGLHIWYESITPTSEIRGTVLLIMGNGGSAFDWPPKFVRSFVDAGYHTIRYDHRGTGISDRVEKWSRKNPYTVADMSGDAVAVLDALGVQTAHVVGLSMGGMIAQEVAAAHPERVASLTLLSTSGYVGDPDLPGLTSSYFMGAFVKSVPLLKYRVLGGEKNLIKERIAKMVVALGASSVDIKETAEVVLYDLRKRRGVSIQGALQHQAAVTVSGSRYDKLRALDAPTLVVHGTADPLIPVEHGRKLVDVIPNATGLWLNGVGHVFPYPDMRPVTEAILAHLSEAG